MGILDTCYGALTIRRKIMNENLLNQSTSETMPKITLAFSTASTIMDVEASRIVYSNLLKELQEKLLSRFPKREWEKLLAKLKEHEQDVNFFRGSGHGVLLFVDADTNEKIEVSHDISPYVYVGNQFLLKDLLTMEETSERPKYLIEIGKDRFFSWSIQDYEPLSLQDFAYNLSDYFEDFDNNSNLNVGNYGGLDGQYHGHRTKEEEEAKEQKTYYRYLNEKLVDLSTKDDTKIVLCGVQEVVTKFLDESNNKSYVYDVLAFPLSKANKKELQTSVEAIFEKEYDRKIGKVRQEIENASREGKLVHDMEAVQENVTNGLVKKVIFLEKNDGYSVEHNQLMIHCLKSNIKPIVLRSDTDEPAINAILY